MNGYNDIKLISFRNTHISRISSVYLWINLYIYIVILLW